MPLQRLNASTSITFEQLEMTKTKPRIWQEGVCGMPNLCLPFKMLCNSYQSKTKGHFWIHFTALQMRCIKLVGPTQILLGCCRIACIAQAVNRAGGRRISVLIHGLVQQQPGYSCSLCPPCQRLGHTLLVPKNYQGHSNRLPWPPARGSGGHWGHCDMMASSIWAWRVLVLEERRDSDLESTTQRCKEIVTPLSFWIAHLKTN